MIDIQRSNFVHFVPVTVRWGEMDALGHVNNAIFHRYAEDGRIEYILRVVDANRPTAKGVGPVLVDMRCSFRQQLRYPAQVEVATRTTAFGHASLQVQQALFHHGSEDVVAAYEAVLVWYDFDRQASAAVPGAVRARIRALEAVAPTEPT